jgi:signal transduction histidine kinase
MQWENTKENVMNKRIFTAALMTSALLWSAGLVSAQSSGTAAEARAMLDNAVAALKANEATALASFNDKSNTKFHDRDLYVFCYNMSDGKFTAHTNSAMMGTDVRALKAKDDPLGQRIFDTINKSSGGSVLTVDYNFPKPGTTEPVPKQSFVTKVGNQGCGVGYYK